MIILQRPFQHRRLVPLSVVLLAGVLGGCAYSPYPYPAYSYSYTAYPTYAYSYNYPPLYSSYFYGAPSAEPDEGGNK